MSLEVFYDGDCPLCRREIALLRRWDKHQRIAFTDLASPDFNASELGKTHEELMAVIHARTDDGQMLTGVEVFRQIYLRLGFRTAVAISRWPGIAGLLEFAYRLFARYRLPITGRCNGGTCRLNR